MRSTGIDVWGWFMLISLALPAFLAGGCFPARPPSPAGRSAVTALPSPVSEPAVTPGVALARPTSTLAATVAGVAAGQEAAEVRVRPLPAAVNIRRGPGTAYEIVGILQNNATAVVLARDGTGSWFNVVTDVGLNGWVAVNVVEVVSGEAVRVEIAATEPAAPPAGNAQVEPLDPTPTIASVVQPGSKPPKATPTTNPAMTAPPSPYPGPTVPPPPSETPNPYP